MTSSNPIGLCESGCGQVTPIAKVTRRSRNHVAGEHKPYCGVACANRARTGYKTLEDRFWSKVEKTDGCWIWLGTKTRAGHGQFALTGDRKANAHRLAYELSVGPIPDGLTLDHLCHTNDVTCQGGAGCPHRACVNPAHLEPVTQRENVLRARTAPTAINARKTECIRGHEFSGANLAIDSRGHRQCRECRRQRHRERGRAA